MFGEQWRSLSSAISTSTAELINNLCPFSFIPEYPMLLHRLPSKRICNRFGFQSNHKLLNGTESNMIQQSFLDCNVYHVAIRNIHASVRTNIIIEVPYALTVRCFLPSSCKVVKEMMGSYVLPQDA